MPERIEPESLFDTMRDYFQRGIYTALPGKVHAYNSTNQTAEIEVQTVTEGNDVPIIPSVPVIWPRGGTAYIHLPLTSGDFGLIICCKDDIGSWRQRGEQGDPGEIGQHGLQNAVFLPGLVPSGNDIATVDNAVVISGDEVLLGDSGATEKVICGTDFKLDMADFEDKLSAWMSAVDTAIDAIKTEASLVTVVLTNHAATETALEGWLDATYPSPSVKAEKP